MTIYIFFWGHNYYIPAGTPRECNTSHLLVMAES